MKFIKEEEFTQLMQGVRIVHCNHGRSLCFRDEASILGFDFTNMNIPDHGASPYEGVAAGDRSIEYIMVSSILKIIAELDLFPLYLYPVDDDWADEDLEPLVKRGLLTPEEGAVLDEVVDSGHAMDIIVVDKGEMDLAVRLVTPQMTAFSKTCAVADGKGRVLTTFSQDDEVSFNTTDKNIYEKASLMMKSLSGLPFDVIWAEGE